MEINVTSRRADLSDLFKKRVQKKLDRLDSFFNEPAVAHIVATTEKDRKTVELTIKSGQITLRSQKTTFDFIESFDDALAAIMKQLIKNKTKLEKRFKQKAYDIDYLELLGENYAEEENESAEFKVVKNKKFIVKPMDVQEAILQMNLIGHEFYVFRDMATEELNVVYRRRDGAYGVIEARLLKD